MRTPAINFLLPEVTKMALRAVVRMKNQLGRGKPLGEHEPFGQSLGQSFISGEISAIFNKAWPPSLARHNAQIPKFLVLFVADIPLVAQFLLVDHFERAGIGEVLG